MRKQFVTVALLVGVMGAISVMAEEPEINPIRVKTRQINAYGTNPIQIMGTNMTATAAQLNAAGGGTTATISPTTANITTCNAGTVKANTVTASNTLTIAKQSIKTADTVSVTKGAFTLTVTNDLVLITNHYGVVTCSVAAATSPGQEVEIWNLVGTNIVFPDSAGLMIPTGYSEWTNGINDMIKFRAVGTNWQCSGYSDL